MLQFFITPPFEMSNLTLLIPVFGLLALVYTFWRAAWVARQDPGTEKMQRIADAIAVGAMAFLRAEYRVLAIFVGSVALLLLAGGFASEDSHPMVAVSFVGGAFCSALAGYIGMRVATKANVRTTQAARKSLGAGLAIAFAGGSVMGLGVVGLGLLGLGTLFAIFGPSITDADSARRVMNIITGFSFGASSIALFARVGGGIYTKAADVGADLVGKVEAGIPEDHPLNPATIADNVGDNVGDVAGMGADLFESYVGSIIATMVIGSTFLTVQGFEAFGGLGAVLLPMLLAGLGIVASIIGTFLVKVKEGGNPHRALNTGEIAAGVIMLVGTFFVVQQMLPEKWTIDGREFTSMGVFIAITIGLASGIAIGYITEYYTGTGTKPVIGIVERSVTGSATNIIAGLGVGMLSTALPILVLAAAILTSHHFAGLYGIAIAAVGMLANTGVQLAVDAYGPISDNAGGIAQMSGLPKEVRQRTDKLDAVGNTTAAIGKGFAIGSAALTALALFAAFKTTWEATHGGTKLVIELTDPKVVASLFVGGMLPFLFSAFAMDAVGRAAMAMIEEVRRQFREIPGLKAGLDAMNRNEGNELETWSAVDLKLYDDAHGQVQYGTCVEISTKAAIREMVKPGLLAVAVPVIVGFGGNLLGAGSGAQMLGGLLAGVTVTGVLMALFQANSGGAWDNAKKMIEEGIVVNGVMLGKGSDAHKAAVVGDTVGDPFKDTSGPSLNILLKLMSVVALVIASMI